YLSLIDTWSAGKRYRGWRRPGADTGASVRTGEVQPPDVVSSAKRSQPVLGLLPVPGLSGVRFSFRNGPWPDSRAQSRAVGGGPMGGKRYSRPLTLLAAASLARGVTATMGAAARPAAGPAGAG